MTDTRTEHTPGITAADTIPGFAEMIDALAEKLQDIPLVPILASSEAFPSEHAWSFTDGRQQYMLAGPAFWSQVPSRAPSAFGLLSGVEIIDLDDERNEARAKQVFDAIAAHLDRVDAERAAKAIEARRVETGTGSVHESAVPQAFAQDIPGDSA